MLQLVDGVGDAPYNAMQILKNWVLNLQAGDDPTPEPGARYTKRSTSDRNSYGCAGTTEAGWVPEIGISCVHARESVASQPMADLRAAVLRTPIGVEDHAFILKTAVRIPPHHRRNILRMVPCIIEYTAVCWYQH